MLNLKFDTLYYTPAKWTSSGTRIIIEKQMSQDINVRPLLRAETFEAAYLIYTK